MINRQTVEKFRRVKVGDFHVDFNAFEIIRSRCFYLLPGVTSCGINGDAWRYTHDQTHMCHAKCQRLIKTSLLIEGDTNSTRFSQAVDTPALR